MGGICILIGIYTYKDAYSPIRQLVGNKHLSDNPSQVVPSPLKVKIKTYGMARYIYLAMQQVDYGDHL